jgi:hypothetical protein
MPFLGNTATSNLISLGRRLYSLGEAHLMALLLDLEKEWASLSGVQARGNMPFPLSFAETQAAGIKEDMQLADKGIEMMQYMVKEFGDLWPEKGLVPHDQYDRVKSELRDAMERLVEYLQLSESERKEFSNLWPFDS